MDTGRAYLKMRPTLPPEAPLATPSARAKSSLTSTTDTVPFTGGTGVGAFGAFPRWIADLLGSTKAKTIDDIPVTRNCGITMQMLCNPYSGGRGISPGP
jgi:hypothetical protein